jgi:AcrR family transcriptional regulator
MGFKERKKREKEILTKTRVKQILEAAKKVFHKKGFSKTTMEDIAREAELSAGALYIYFGSKNDIYASLNISILEHLNKELINLYDNKLLTNYEKFRALGDVYFKMYEYDSVMLLNLFQLQSSELLGTLSPELLDSINKLASESVKWATKIVERAMKEGIIKHYQPVAIVDLIWGMFTGVVLWEESKRFFSVKKNYLKQTLDAGWDIFHRGIRTGDLR